MEALTGELGGPTPGSRESDEPHYKDVEVPNFQVNEVQRYPKSADYPMDGEQLAARAEENGAPSELVELLRSLSKVEGPSGVMNNSKITSAANPLTSLTIGQPKHGHIVKAIPPKVGGRDKVCATRINVRS